MEFINSLIFGQTKPILIINIVTGVVAWANPASGILFECTCTELIGKHLAELHPNDEHDYILEQLQLVITDNYGKEKVAHILTSTAKRKQVVITIANSFEIDKNRYIPICYKDS